MIILKFFSRNWSKIVAGLCAFSCFFMTFCYSAYATEKSSGSDSAFDIIDGVLSGDDYADIVGGMFQTYVGPVPGLGAAFSDALKSSIKLGCRYSFSVLGH